MLYYISDADLPSKKAHTIQQMRMCQAFERAGASVCFVHPSHDEFRKSLSWDDIADYYGLDTEFEIRTVPSLHDRVPRVPQAGVLSMAGSMTGWIASKIASGTITGSDVVYGRNYYGTFFINGLFQLLPPNRRPKVVFEHHDILSAHYKKRFYNSISGLVCITNKLKEYDSDTFGIPKSEIHVAPDGVDLDAYQDWDQPRARAKIGIPASERVVMYTGHLYDGKGAQVLARAARYLDATVYIVGGYDDDIDRIRRSVNDLANVEFTGFVPPSAIPEYQVAADVLVAPYTTDARDFLSPLKLFEYMAAGRPIVASDLDVLREVLTNGRNALLVPPGDPSALADNIDDLLSDTALYDTMTDEVRKDAERYSWERRASDILSFIDSL